MSKIMKGSYTKEAVAGFNSRTALEESARCLLCHDAPCSKGCPAGSDPGAFIRAIRFRNPKGAAEIIREHNVCGATCAQVCPYDNLCEEACSRCGIDVPIQIGKLQRYAMEQEKAFSMKILKAPAKKLNKKVVCVGAGPASLACAAELAKAGVKVTIFDKNEKAGGVLTYGIASSRLPQKVVDQDIASVKGLGVKFELGKEVSFKKDALSFMKAQSADALFLGTGLWKAKELGVPGEDTKGVINSIDFLKKARLNKGYSAVKGKSVVVIGGGDVAMDCAAAAALSGAASVAIWYRRSIGEAPAIIDEINYITNLGVSMTTGFAPKKISKAPGGLLVEFSGRDGKSSAQVSCHYLITAIGQAPVDHSSFLPGGVNEKGGVVVNKKKATKVKGVFAAGDIANGGDTVVYAVAEGKVAAEQILAYLKVGV